MFHVFYYDKINEEWELVDSYDIEKDAHTIAYNLSCQGYTAEIQYFCFKALGKAS